MVTLNDDNGLSKSSAKMMLSMDVAKVKRCYEDRNGKTSSKYQKSL